MITFKVDNLKDMNASLQGFAEYLKDCSLTDDEVFFGRLVGCELITNVIRHCGEMAQFSGGVQDDRIVICVSSDGGEKFSLCPKLPELLAESGRGLYIVNVICDGDLTLSGNRITARIKLGRTLF